MASRLNIIMRWMAPSIGTADAAPEKATATPILTPATVVTESITASDTSGAGGGGGMNGKHEGCSRTLNGRSKSLVRLAMRSSRMRASNGRRLSHSPVTRSVATEPSRSTCTLGTVPFV